MHTRYTPDRCDRFTVSRLRFRRVVGEHLPVRGGRHGLGRVGGPFPTNGGRGRSRRLPDRERTSVGEGSDPEGPDAPPPATSAPPLPTVLPSPGRHRGGCGVPDGWGPLRRLSPASGGLE